MEFSTKPIQNNKNTNLVTIVDDDGLEVDTWRVEMKFHHVLSVTWMRKTKDGLLLNARIGASLPIRVEDELRKWLRKK